MSDNTTDSPEQVAAKLADAIERGVVLPMELRPLVENLLAPQWGERAKYRAPDQNIQPGVGGVMDDGGTPARQSTPGFARPAPGLLGEREDRSSLRSEEESIRAGNGMVRGQGMPNVYRGPLDEWEPRPPQSRPRDFLQASEDERRPRHRLGLIASQMG